MVARVLLVLLLAAEPAAAARKPDPLAAARQFYNLGQYEQAIAAARQAAGTPPTVSSARLVMGRSRLELYRGSTAAKDLEDARSDLRAVDAWALDARERAELQVGLGELLFFDDRFGAAAELMDAVAQPSSPLAADARARALDWWGMALEREAQGRAAADRAPLYLRIIRRMEEELRRDPSSAPAGFWLASAARSAGDLDRAWAAALAGWIRAPLARDRGVALRADLDKLVTQGIVPDRAARAPARDRRQVQTALAADWEAFKRVW